jgi:molybdopterin-guanine dinucleotide biosynthesis protein MobB
VRIIPVAGLSGSGKTTFIRELIPALEKRGTVGVVKHLGHHEYCLEPEKDTTLFYEAGAGISAGVDREKLVLAARGGDLGPVLTTLADMGVAYAVIEGFKSSGYPKVVIGDLESEDCLLRNPTVPDVISSLRLFPEYFTCAGMARELGERKAPAFLLTARFPAPEGADSSDRSATAGACCRGADEQVIVRVSHGIPSVGPAVLIALSAGSPARGAALLSDVIRHVGVTI